MVRGAAKDLLMRSREILVVLGHQPTRRHGF
jgi:hypothetical protein